MRTILNQIHHAGALIYSLLTGSKLRRKSPTSISNLFEYNSRYLSVISAGFLALLLSSCSMLGAKKVMSSNTASKYVVIGDNGVTKISEDGRVWVSGGSSESNLWNAVNVANGQLFAVGMNGAVSYSTNAVNWSDVYSQDHRVWLYDVIFANKRYVAVGMGGMIVSSANLRDWQQATTNTKSWLTSISYGNGIFISSGASGALLKSHDGLAWQLESSPTQEWLSTVNFVNNKFLAVGSSGTILNSSTGEFWQLLSSPTKNWLYGVSYGAGRYTVVGENSTILSSVDGQNWSIVRHKLPKHIALRSVIYADNQFVIVGAHGLIATSHDGLIWQKQDSTTKRGLYSITYYNPEITP